MLIWVRGSCIFFKIGKTSQFGYALVTSFSKQEYHMQPWLLTLALISKLKKMQKKMV